MRGRLLRASVVLLIALGSASWLPGQTSQVSAQKLPAFEVASVKKSSPGEAGPFIRRDPGGRITVANMPVRDLITYAYRLAPSQLIGGPSWTVTDHFDVVAKLEGTPELGLPGSGPDPVQLAMRTLLAERFRLKAHQEMREMDIYALVMIKPGVAGPALKPISTECAATIAAGPGAHAKASAPAPSRTIAPCGGIGIGAGVIRFGGFPISQFTPILGERSGRVVADRTGLTGSWQFELRFAPEQGGQRSPDAEVSASDSNAPTFVTALQEQLGLKLEPVKAPVDVLVIDHVEPPTED